MFLSCCESSSQFSVCFRLCIGLFPLGFLGALLIRMSFCACLGTPACVLVSVDQKLERVYPFSSTLSVWFPNHSLLCVRELRTPWPCQPLVLKLLRTFVPSVCLSVSTPPPVYACVCVYVHLLVWIHTYVHVCGGLISRVV